jgi:hypothetical protein
MIRILKELHLIGGVMLGCSIPIGSNILPCPDYYVFLPLGLILLSISYYYNFIKKI